MYEEFEDEPQYESNEEIDREFEDEQERELDPEEELEELDVDDRGHVRPRRRRSRFDEYEDEEPVISSDEDEY